MKDEECIDYDLDSEDEL